MADQKLVRLEKAIEEKIKVPKPKKTGAKFVVDVEKLKKLAQRLNEYEARSNAITQ